jgi:hypothetical protein
MSYGNCLCWNGEALTDATYSGTSTLTTPRLYTLRITFIEPTSGRSALLTGPFNIRDGDDGKDIAARIATEWNRENPQGRQALHNPAYGFKVCFEGIVDKMAIQLDGGSWKDIKFGERTELETGLFVFNG